MAYDLEEQETLDAIKDWWAQYGTLIVVVVLVAAASVAGWRGWQWYQGHKALQAMGYFEAIEVAAKKLDDESMQRIQAASDTLRNDFPKSGYTNRGLLVAAKAMQDIGNLDGAQQQLDWLINNSNEIALKNLAKLRLANVLYQKQDYDKALSLLDNPSDAFKGLYADAKGDIYAAQGNKEKAQQSWEEALFHLTNDPLAQVIQLKLSALTGA